MKDCELTPDQSLAANQLAAKLIEKHADDFDIEIARQANDLAHRVCQHRNINLAAARKIVADFIEAN